jgi:hypothetical protein
MIDIGDLMMDFCFEHEAHGPPTGDLYLEALKTFPGREREVESYFVSWVWLEWCDANLPTRESTEEEAQAFVEEGMKRFYARLAEMRAG